MRKIILFLFLLFTLNTISYASFPVSEDLKSASLTELQIPISTQSTSFFTDGRKALLWGVLSVFFFYLLFPPILAIRYGFLAWNDRDYIAARIGLFLGVFGIVLGVFFLVLLILSWLLGSAYGGMH
jgi:hypothetical protein